MTPPAYRVIGLPRQQRSLRATRPPANAIPYVHVRDGQGGERRKLQIHDAGDIVPLASNAGAPI